MSHVRGEHIQEREAGEITDRSPSPHLDESGTHEPGSGNSQIGRPSDRGIDQESETGEPPQEEQRISSTVEPSNSETLLDELNQCVKQVQDGISTKQEAISKVIKILEGNPLIKDIEQEKAFQLYLAEISSIGNAPPGKQRTKRSRDKFEGRKEQNDIDKQVNGLLDEISNQQTDGEDSEEDEEPRRKKRKIKESDMPWYKERVEENANRSPSAKETCRLLRLYSEDPTRAKFFIKLAVGCPPAVPSSQWDRIVRGEPVDLNQILSSLHSCAINEEAETRVGDAKISIGVAKAKREVKTASEWSTAWRYAARAIRFVFPMRANELQDYGDYIEGEFAAKEWTDHSQVILYDIAIRNLVGAGQNIELTDTHEFLRLYSAIMLPGGVQSRKSNKRSSPKEGRSGGSKSEICNRFNTSTGCRFTDDNCRYKHLCKKCRKSGHAGPECTN